MKEYFIDGDEVLLAIRNWDKIMNNGKNKYPSIIQHKGPYRFSTFIGPHELIAGRYIDIDTPVVRWGWKVSQPAYDKIMLLASPHHYALLCAFKAKTGWQGVIP